MENVTWLLLLYELPTKRGSARVSLWRQLKKFGALPLKTSAYVLPNTPAQAERFQWLSTQIKDAGGDATLIRVAQIEGMTNHEIVALFNEARAADYQQLAEACRATLAGHKRADRAELAADLEKHQRRLHEIRETDYFQSPAVHDVQVLLERIEKLLAPRHAPGAVPNLDPKDFAGRTWLTRPRPGIDRAGSAWLIRKFIDPKARFLFGMDPARHPKALPFDMADAEFSHHGDDCTFETLVKRFGISEKAVLKMAEMVHDADLEDGKFHRSECLGLNCVLSGWAKSPISDAELLAKGMDCFEGLYRDQTK
jgi:hypothetical protein